MKKFISQYKKYMKGKNMRKIISERKKKKIQTHAAGKKSYVFLCNITKFLVYRRYAGCEKLKVRDTHN